VLDSATKHLILAVVEYTCLVLGGMVLAWWAVFVARRPRRFCPGRRRPLAAWLWPFTWVTLPSCGYDLSGVADGRVCPECGCCCGKRRRTPGSFAHIRVCTALLCAGAAVPVGLYLRGGTWAPHLPDTAILAIRATLGGWTPDCVRGEYLRRTDIYRPAGKLEVPPPPGMSYAPWQQRWAVRLLIDDLADDAVRGNGESAVWALSRFPAEMAVPAAEEALASTDYQQRQLAASFLRGVRGYAPTDMLLRVTVEGLRDDQFPAGDGYTHYCNAHDGWEYLLHRMDRAERFVAEGLSGDDAQQRLICAGLVAVTGRGALLDRAGPILVRALGSNVVAEDAQFATGALMNLGGPALAYLEPACRDTDSQRRDRARLMVDRLTRFASPSRRLLRADAERVDDVHSRSPFAEARRMRYTIPSVSAAEP